MTNSGKVGVAVGAGLTHLLVFVFIHDDCRRNEMAEKREKQEKWGKGKRIAAELSTSSHILQFA